MREIRPRASEGTSDVWSAAISWRAIAPHVPSDRLTVSAVPLHKALARNSRQLAIGGQPCGSARGRLQIIVGAFGFARAEMLASELKGAVILDLGSYFILRSLIGRRVFGVHLSPPRFRIVLLLSAVPRLATSAEIEEQLWGDREDGGPDTLYRDIIRHTRRRIAPLGLAIKNEREIGFELRDDGARS